MKERVPVFRNEAGSERRKLRNKKRNEIVPFLFLSREKLNLIKLDKEKFSKIRG